MTFGPIVQTQGQSPYFWDIGEGYTGEDGSRGLQVSWRQFSAPDLEPLCASSPTPDRLVARESHIELKVGETISFQDLHVLALDSMGTPLDPIPITVGIEEKAPPIVDLKNYRESTGPIAVIGTGEFLLRIRRLCLEYTEPEKALFIRYSISAR